MLFLHLVFFHEFWRRSSKTRPPDSYCPRVDDPIVVPAGVDITNPTSPGNCSLQGPSIFTATSSSCTPTTQEAVTTGGSFIRDALQGFGLSQSTSALIQESWPPGTRVQYDSLLRGWQVHPLSPTIFDVIAYLTSMYDCGLQYTTIAAAKSVLAWVLHIPGVTYISSYPLIIRLLKGIFHVCPHKPCYEFIWDTGLVLKFLQTLHPAVIPLKLLTLKTVTLLTLLSGQRVSTLHQFRLSQLQSNHTLVIFNIQGLLKHSRAAKRDLPINYHAFPHDVALCPVATLDAYLDARAQLGNAALHDELFLCYRKPYGPATNNTLARWVKMVLHSSGVNLDTFMAHSCRSAFTSKAAATRTMVHLLYLLHLLPKGYCSHWTFSWTPVCIWTPYSKCYMSWPDNINFFYRASAL